MTAKAFAENHQYDLEEHDEGGYLGINEETFAKLLDEYAEAKAKEAYNQGVRDAAESAMMKFHDGFHKENKDIDYFMSGQDNLTVSKQSILKLLK